MKPSIYKRTYRECFPPKKPKRAGSRPCPWCRQERGGLSTDTDRMDYLESKRFLSLNRKYALYFGTWQVSVRRNLRQAIDAAIRAERRPK